LIALPPRLVLFFSPWQHFFPSLPFLSLPFLSLPFLSLPFLSLPFLSLPSLSLPFSLARTGESISSNHVKHDKTETNLFFLSSKRFMHFYFSFYRLAFFIIHAVFTAGKPRTCPNCGHAQGCSSSTSGPGMAATRAGDRGARYSLLGDHEYNDDVDGADAAEDEEIAGPSGDGGDVSKV
jgi:hypothetical protein